MIFRFNKAQLGRERLAALESFLERFQKGEEQELEVSVDEFPDKFSVRAGDAVSFIQWKPEGEGVSAGFYFLPSSVPEPEPEAKPEAKPEAVPNLALEISKARDFSNKVVAGYKSMNPKQRIAFWTEFSELLTQELADAMP